ncbi:hypothetical protein GCM10009818_34090 [Nakamurella flavida]
MAVAASPDAAEPLPEAVVELEPAEPDAAEVVAAIDDAAAEVAAEVAAADPVVEDPQAVSSRALAAARAATPYGVRRERDIRSTPE